MFIQFAELPVFDQDRATRFYTKHLGCHVAADTSMGEGGWRWIELNFEGAETNLHFIRREDDAPSDDPVLVLVDGDPVATIDALRSEGVTVITEPQPAPWAPDQIIAEFRDSEGRMVLAGRLRGSWAAARFSTPRQETN
jgi:catechol 2,3-dioxygenase-like lactoylglutathione lyase family enzyme